MDRLYNPWAPSADTEITDEETCGCTVLVFSVCISQEVQFSWRIVAFVVVALLFYVHGKHLRSCRDGQLT